MNWVKWSETLTQTSWLWPRLLWWWRISHTQTQVEGCYMENVTLYQTFWVDYDWPLDLFSMTQFLLSGNCWGKKQWMQRITVGGKKKSKNHSGIKTEIKTWVLFFLYKSCSSFCCQNDVGPCHLHLCDWLHWPFYYERPCELSVISQFCVSWCPKAHQGS